MKTGRQETQKKKNKKYIYTEIHEKIIQTLRKKNVFCDCVGRRPGVWFLVDFFLDWEATR